jgi:phospholipid/cholesterol/gamma-HCH transport system substrate-binding protein
MPGRVNESLGKLQETLELLADFSAEAKPELLTAAQNLRQTSDSLVNITGRVEHLLVENDAAIDSFLTDGVGETAALVTDARAAMRELEKLSTELRSNPSRVIYKPRLEPVVIAQ